MMRAALLAAASAVAVLVVSLPAGAAGSQTYADPAGDSASAADLVSMTVANDDAGLITLGLKFGNRTQFTDEDVLLVGLDTDRNAQTGAEGGVDYLVILLPTAQSYALATWTGTNFSVSLVPGALSMTDGLSLQINRSALGNTLAFDFFVVTGMESNEDGDVGPDGDAVWTYTVKLKAVIRTVTASYSPAKPKAGKRFAVSTVRVGLATGQTAPATSKRCTARLAGKTLKPAGTCAWVMPKTAKGKTLSVAVTASYADATPVAKTKSFKVG